MKLIQGDIKNTWELSQVFRDHATDEVVHTAANPMLTSGAQQRPYAAIELNIMGTTNVLEAARSFGVQPMVVLSSSVLAVSIEGGEDRGDPAKEEAFPRPNTFYAATKQAVEGIALNYARWLKPARGTLLALRANIEKDRVFNLSMGPTVSPQQMAEALCSAFPGVRTRTGLDRIPGAMFELAGVDMTRAKKVLGFTPEYPLPEAIRDLASNLRR